MLFTWLVFATLMIWIVQYSNAYVNNLHNRLHIRFKFSYSLNIVTINYTSYDSYRMWYLVSSCHIYISKLKQILTSSSEALVPTVLSLRLFNAYRNFQSGSDLRISWVVTSGAKKRVKILKPRLMNKLVFGSYQSVHLPDRK